MATLTEMLRTQIDKSRQFPNDNFGLKVGNDWPQLVRDVMSSKDIKQEITMSFMLTMLAGATVTKKFSEMPKDDPTILERIAEDSVVYENPLKFLYWGIQIGKQMAEIQRLEDMAK